MKSDKSVLVIDTPDSCGHCRLNQKVNPEEIKCWANGKVYEETLDLILYRRANWCPLRPLPSKKYEHPYPHETNEYAYGWNDCLKEITGEEE